MVLSKVCKRFKKGNLLVSEHEEKLKALEEEKPDAMEVAKEENKEGKKTTPKQKVAK